MLNGRLKINGLNGFTSHWSRKAERISCASETSWDTRRAFEIQGMNPTFQEWSRERDLREVDNSSVREGQAQWQTRDTKFIKSLRL